MSIVEAQPAPAPISSSSSSPGKTATPIARRGWLRRLVPREYVPARIGRRGKAGSATGSPSPSSSYRRLASMLSWSKTAASAAAPTATGATGSLPSSYRRLASSLSRSLRWKRLPGLPSIGLRAGSASAALDEVAFRVMYVVEAVVLGLALSCFFLCCGCHL